MYARTAHDRWTTASNGALALVQAEGLPVSDLTDAHLEHFYFAGSDASPTARVGLEIYGTDALLRSLVVSAEARTKGTRSALVLHAGDYASAHHVRAIYIDASIAGMRRRRSNRHGSLPAFARRVQRS